MSARLASKVLALEIAAGLLVRRLHAAGAVDADAFARSLEEAARGMRRALHADEAADLSALVADALDELADACRDAEEGPDATGSTRD